MAVFFDCDIVETLSPQESAQHLCEICSMVASPLIFKQVSTFGRKGARPKQGAAKDNTWIAQLMVIPGISE